MTARNSGEQPKPSAPAPVAFDDSTRCRGHHPEVRGSVLPMCLTCRRLTYRRDVPVLEPKPYMHAGTWDCEHWKAHAVNLHGIGRSGISLAHEDGEVPSTPMGDDS